MDQEADRLFEQDTRPINVKSAYKATEKRPGTRVIIRLAFLVTREPSVSSGVSSGVSIDGKLEIGRIQSAKITADARFQREMAPTTVTVVYEPPGRKLLAKPDYTVSRLLRINC